MMYKFLADVVVGIHLGFLIFTLIGQFVILAGVFRGWQWVRNFWFRIIHLGFIVFVAAEYVVGLQSPLWTLECDLRETAWDKEKLPGVAVSTVGVLGSPMAPGPLLAASGYYGGTTNKVEATSFVGQCMNKIIFFDVEWDHPAFGIGYGAFALMVLGTFVFSRPLDSKSEGNNPWSPKAHPRL